MHILCHTPCHTNSSQQYMHVIAVHDGTIVKANKEYHLYSLLHLFLLHFYTLDT